MKARLLLLTAFGLGYLRPAPGTWGSTPPVILAGLLILVLGLDDWQSFDLWTINLSMALLGLAFAVACVRFGEEAEAHFGGKDPSPVVADEVAGQSLALLAIPWQPLTGWAALRDDAVLAAIAFLAFRCLDIIKPPPARRLQRLRGGWGILVDDLFAGAYALIAVQIVIRLFW